MRWSQWRPSRKIRLGRPQDARRHARGGKVEGTDWLPDEPARTTTKPPPAPKRKGR